MSDEYLKIVDNIMNQFSSMKSIQESIWKFFTEEKCDKPCGADLNIVVLNGPCNGFGDLVFAVKLRNYLIEWYGSTVTLVTTHKSGMEKLGVYDSIRLTGPDQPNCKSFAEFKLQDDIETQDLIFVAPVYVGNKDKIMKDVKTLFPYSNKLNTFLLSEYNNTDNFGNHFTFSTGVGEDRDGLLLTTIDTKSVRPLTLKNPFALVYITNQICKKECDKCILSFVDMVVKKYNKKEMFHNFDIVIPSWFTDDDHFFIREKITENVKEEYPNVVLVTTTEKIYMSRSDDKKDKKLTFRCDVLPVTNEEMINLIRNSIKDILVTGDQSITDVLSCCSYKNIFYQIVPWKKNFAGNLARYMPNIYLKDQKTSCGTIDALEYKSDYKTFVEEWDFRTRSRPKMNGIILSAIYIKQDKDIHNLYKIILKSKTKDEVIEKIQSIQKKVF